MKKSMWLFVLAASVIISAGCASQDVVVSAPAKTGGSIVLRAVGVEAEENKPFEAGKAAAEALKKAMGDTPLKAVILTECLEGREMKAKALAGAASVLGKDVIFGGSTYGAYNQKGAMDLDAVSLLGIGGDGISVSAALVTNMGAEGLSLEKNEAELTKALQGGGKALAQKLPKSDKDRLMIIMADAHSPKNAFFVNGVHEVLGGKFPLAGGSVNKNAGQTFVYFKGGMYSDSAVGLMLSGDFKVSLAGRKAKTNDKVISTARDATAEAVKNLKTKPMAMIAFDCAGRMGKLKKLDDELKAIQSCIGKKIPLYGCYCAGEIGPADVTEKKADVLSSGNGWHIMVTVIGR
jgi:hypothetical protein